VVSAAILAGTAHLGDMPASKAHGPQEGELAAHTGKHSGALANPGAPGQQVMSIYTCWVLFILCVSEKRVYHEPLR